MVTHDPTICQRVGQPLYVGKGYKARFECSCGRHTYQHLNFLGRRNIVCDGAKFAQVAK
jgi:hypothetical protein